MTLFFKVNQIKYINVYVYTYSRLVVISPTAANEKRVRRGFCRKNSINTIIFTPTHAPVVFALPNSLEIF